MSRRHWSSAAERGPMRQKLISLVARCGLATRVMPQETAARLLISGIRAEGRTWISRRRLKHLHAVCSDPLLPHGSLVECGVGRGGGVAVMAGASRGKRAVWGFDSFSGMPPLTEEDQEDGRKWVGFKCSGADGTDEVQKTFRRFSVPEKWATIVPGWFEDTLPRYVDRLRPIAILRLDNDWYKSTRYCLEVLCPAVVPNGMVLVDDYHTFVGCRKAVDEFRETQGIKSPLITIESDSEVYWRKVE